MASKAFFSTKLKDLPAFMSKTLSAEGICAMATDYSKTFLHVDSHAPVLHMAVGVFTIGYAMTWSTEYAHWKHDQHNKMLGH
eukprot:gene18208-21691_t